MNISERFNNYFTAQDIEIGKHHCSVSSARTSNLDIDCSCPSRINRGEAATKLPTHTTELLSKRPLPQNNKIPAVTCQTSRMNIDLMKFDSNFNIKYELFGSFE